MASQAPYTVSCDCNVRFPDNCAHFLSNWMIKNQVMLKSPQGCYCCKAGRPIRAKEIRDHIFPKIGSKHTEEPPAGQHCWVYCERKSDGQGHVYYGTKDLCIAGTGNGAFGADCYEYYY